MLPHQGIADRHIAYMRICKLFSEEKINGHFLYGYLEHYGKNTREYCRQPDSDRAG